MPAKYRIIARELEQRLQRADGMLRLPTEAALCAEYGCSRQTVRSALGILEDKGLIVRRQGSGSYPVQNQPSRQIAVLLADREEYTTPALLREIRKAAEAYGCTVLCLETGGSRETERGHLQKLLKQPPAGILIEPICDVLGCFCEDLLRRLTQAGIPIVYLNGGYHSPIVRYDDPAGAGLLMAHLAAQGHKKIAAIFKSDDSRGIERFRGCLRVADDLMLELRTENILWYSEQDRLELLEGDDALLRRFLHTRAADCSAVICHNDALAYRLLRLVTAEHSGLRIVSFDNSYLARDASLTSIGAEQSSVGAEAVRLLLDKGSTSVTLPCKLHPRRSG